MKSNHCLTHTSTLEWHLNLSVKLKSLMKFINMQLYCANNFRAHKIVFMIQDKSIICFLNFNKEFTYYKNKIIQF